VDGWRACEGCPPYPWRRRTSRSTLSSAVSLRLHRREPSRGRTAGCPNHRRCKLVSHHQSPSGNVRHSLPQRGLSPGGCNRQASLPLAKSVAPKRTDGARRRTTVSLRSIRTGHGLAMKPGLIAADFVPSRARDIEEHERLRAAASDLSAALVHAAQRDAGEGHFPARFFH
jgi:hypothetical protein